MTSEDIILQLRNIILPEEELPEVPLLPNMFSFLTLAAAVLTIQLQFFIELDNQKDEQQASSQPIHSSESPGKSQEPLPSRLERTASLFIPLDLSLLLIAVTYSFVTSVVFRK